MNKNMIKLNILVFIFTLINQSNLNSQTNSIPVDCEGIFFSYTKKNKFGIKDNNSKVILKPKFDTIIISCNNAGIEGFYVRKNGKCGFYNFEGNVILDEKYEEIDFTKSKNVFIIKLDEKYGFFKSNGNIMFEPIYSSIEMISYLFDPPYFKVSQKNKFGVHRINGLKLVEPLFDDVELTNGEIIVELNEKKGTIDRNGNEIIPIKFDEIQIWKSGHVNIVKQNEKFGMYNKKGEVVFPVIYDKLSLYPQGFIEVWKDSKIGYFYFTGEIIEEVTWQDKRMKGRNYELFNGKEWIEIDIMKKISELKQK